MIQNSFFLEDDYIKGFGRVMVDAEELYESFVKTGHREYAFIQPDCFFISDKKQKLSTLADFLLHNYGYEIGELKADKNLWAFNTIAIKFPCNKETFMYWALDMYNKAYRFDYKTDGYGSTIDAEDPEFPNLDESLADSYYETALADFNNDNFSGCAINLTTAIKIRPEDTDYYYLRAMAKTDLKIWKSALRDYDESIRIAPNYVDALVNRGAVKDDHEDYFGAMEDYNLALTVEPNDPTAHFNRGNTKFNLGDKKGACEDWKKAKELGAGYAQQRIDEDCK